MVKNTGQLAGANKLCWGKSADLDVICAALKESKVVVGTSDTVPGLLAPLTKEGAAKLDAIKGRKDKPYIILIAKKSLVEKFVPLDGALAIQVERLMGNCWPGPLTLIFKARQDLAPWLVAANGTISLRVPWHEGLQSLLQHFDGLFSTSANKTGQPTPQNLDEVDPAILAEVEFWIGDDAENKNATIKPSSILDCTGERIKMIREGAFTKVKLEAICASKIE